MPQGAGRRARRPRHRLGLGDRHRRAAGPRPREGRRHATRSARASSRRSLELSNGGALDITVGQYFTPNGPQPRRRRRQARARASRPTSGRRTTRRRRRDEALDRRAGASRGASVPALSRRAAARRRRAREARALPRRRAVLRARAPASTVDARRATRAPGDLVLLRPPARGGGHAQDRARLGRPDVARDVHRGADARPRAARARFPTRRSSARRARPREAAPTRRRAPRPARPADVHDRPGDRAGLRRRDLRRGARRRRAGASGCTSPTSSRLRAPGLAGRPRGLPARDERLRARARSSRCCPRRCPTTPARSCPGEDRLAVTVELELRRRARCVEAAFHRSLIRSDERLDYDRVDRIFAGDEPRRGAVGASRSRPRARRRPRSQARARARAARWPSSRSSPSSRSTARGHVVEARGDASQTESHRLIEHLMIAANEAVATLLDERAMPDALPRPRAPRAARGVERLVEQLASLDVADAAGARAHVARSRRPTSSRECSRARRRSTCAAPATAAPALTSLVLRSLKQARYSPAQPRPRRPAARRATATSPRRSAATPTSSATARCSARSAAGEDAPRGRARWTRPPTWTLGARARRDDRSSATPTTSRAASCSSASCSRAAGTESRRRGRRA